MSAGAGHASLLRRRRAFHEADGVEKAVRESALLRSGVVLWRGKVVGTRLGQIQQIPTITPDGLLDLLV